MPERRALVLNDEGVVAELPAGDSLTGAGGTVPVFVASGQTFVVPAGQVLFSEEIDLEGDMDLDGILVEVT